MIDSVGMGVRRVVAGWRTEVERRRKVSGLDPVADALDFCAAEILAAVKEAEQSDRWCSVAEYAVRVHKSEATVRKWIRRGDLRAERTAGGDYRIFTGPKAA